MFSGRNFCRLIILFQVYQPNIRQYPPYFAVNLFITMTSFPYFLLITLRKFVHYVDHIYRNSFITLTKFPQSMNNTVFCGIQFQISPIILWDVFQFGVYCKFTIKSELEYILMWLWIIWFQISPNLWSLGNRCYLRTRQSGIIRLYSWK